MKCPVCKHEESEVKETVAMKDGAIRRRRECCNCETRYTTHEIRVDKVPIRTATLTPKILVDALSTDESQLRRLLDLCQKAKKKPAPPNPAHKESFTRLAVELLRKQQEKQDV